MVKQFLSVAVAAITIVICIVIGLYLPVIVPHNPIELNKVLAQGATQQTIYLSASPQAAGNPANIAWSASIGGTITTTTNINYSGTNPIFHQFTTTSTDNGGTCAGYMYGNIQGSYDNSNWFYMGQRYVGAVSIDGHNVTRSYVAYGSYPFLRLQVATLPTANCLISAKYTGSLTGSITDNSTIGTVQGSQFYIGGSLNPASGSNTVVNFGSELLWIEVYSLHISNTAANQSIIFEDGSGGVLWEYQALQAGQAIDIPNTGQAIFSSIGTGTPNKILLVLGITGNTDTAFQYRAE
jgi:hypothetical protein